MSGVTRVQLTVSDEEADEMAQHDLQDADKTSPGRRPGSAWRSWRSGINPVSTRPGSGCARSPPELVSRGLEVTVVDYRDGSQELRWCSRRPGRPSRSPWTEMVAARAARSAGAMGGHCR